MCDHYAKRCACEGIQPHRDVEIAERYHPCHFGRHGVPHADFAEGHHAVHSDVDKADYHCASRVWLDKNVQTEQISTDTKISAPENANFAVLSPEKDEIFDNLNNYSAVLRFTYGNISFMLTGDAETEVEENILARETDITSNVLKCGHHGSSTSSSMDFLRAVNPAVAVISCGQDNKYGHPHHETLESLSERNCKILRTDTDGTVAVTTDGNTYSVYTWSAENGLSPAA